MKHSRSEVPEDMPKLEVQNMKVQNLGQEVSADVR